MASPGLNYHFASATILTLVFYTKMEKIAAIGGVFAAEKFTSGFCSGPH